MAVFVSRAVAEMSVCADGRQPDRLLAWAAPFVPRLWAVEGARVTFATNAHHAPLL
jgi:hypothetical protein